MNKISNNRKTKWWTWQKQSLNKQERMGPYHDEYVV
jgi:hypothetical protein